MNKTQTQSTKHQPAARRKLLSLLLVLLLLVVIVACQQDDKSITSPSATMERSVEDPGQLAIDNNHDALLQAIPELAEREARFEEALISDQHILLRESGLDSGQDQAQQIAVASEEFQSLSRDPQTLAPLRSEIMTVRAALPSDLTDEMLSLCEGRDCYRVEMFNYGANATVVGIVSLTDEQLLDARFLADVQPELPNDLGDLATEMAIQSVEVAEALGFQPDREDVAMAGVKTALNDSACELTKHLCVAPTFIVPDQNRALWAIIDMTESRLVGIRWTDTGQGDVEPVTEKRLQDSIVMAEYCEKVTPVERDGWSLNYLLTSSDGLAVTDVTFDGNSVVDSAKLVDWHVAYSDLGGYGFSDATGCPHFAAAGIAAYNGPVVEDIVDEGEVIGFSITQDFRSLLWPQTCNYRYLQRNEFYTDGRFRLGAMNVGRGCGNTAAYHPVMRIALHSAQASDGSSVDEWTDGEWVAWEEEQWTRQTETTSYSPEGYEFRITSGDGSGYYLEPDRGQLSENGRGDNAFVYVTTYNEDEGETDMITIGSCCNTDYRQGPERFMEPAEPLDGEPLVLWYVPWVENNDTPGEEYCWVITEIEEGLPVPKTFPCLFGPMFVPATTQ